MDVLNCLLRNARVQDLLSSVTIQGTAAFAALLLILRFYASKKRTTDYVTDLSKVGYVVDAKDGAHAAEVFDVIIVGGGTAGCVLASRLSEDPTIKVLLLEAGESGADLAMTKVPVRCFDFWLSKYEWGMYTEPQANASGRKMFWPRAKLLGGCTNMNAMMFHYGAPSDYDEWAALQRGQPGADGWSYERFHPYFQKFEKYNPSGDFPDVDVTLRGAQGLVNIGYHGHFGTSTAAFIKASLNAGIAHSHDINTHKGTLGVTKHVASDLHPSKGRRMTAEMAYLTPKVLARPNLKVAINARATRVLFDTTATIPRAVGVEFTDQYGSKYVANASKEVVMSAGSIHTPQILMLSGIGPAEHLSSFNIPVVKDLPGVGSRLTDHIVVDLAYMDKSKTSLQFLKPQNPRQWFKFVKAVAQYQLFGKGPLTCNVGEAAGFVRTDDPALFPPSPFVQQEVPEDNTTGPGAPDIEIFSSPLAYKEHGMNPSPCLGQDAFMLHTVLLRTKSHGTLRLRSSNPADLPLLDPKYLSDDNDIKVLVRGIKLLQKISRTEPVASMVDPAGDTDPELQHHLGDAPDAEIKQYCRDNVQTLYHPACTARMAPLEDGGVVDPFLRVHGIPNLRIADASVFPSIVAGHTTAPCYAIGEKAADLIKNTVGGTRGGKRYY